MASQLDFPEGKRPRIYLPVRRWLNLFAVADFVRAAADKPLDFRISRDAGKSCGSAWTQARRAGASALRRRLSLPA
jgi:hypothetical protein